MQSLLKVLMIATLCASRTTAAQPPNPWQGVYKMDPGRSHLGGDTIIYTKSPDGTWHFHNGSFVSNFTPDSQPHPLGPANTQTATMPNPKTLDIVIQSNGHTAVTIHNSLSPDANTLTNVTTVAATNSTVTTTYTRTAPGEGLLGSWISTTVLSSDVATLTIAVASDGTYTWIWQNGQEKSTITGKPDNTPLSFAGQNPDRTLAFKYISPHRMEFTNRNKDKVLTTGYLELSDDGKTLDDVYWDPADPSQKGDKLYIRQ